MVYLCKFENNENVPIDSTLLSEKGEFKFVKSSPEVNFYKILFDDKEYLIIARNGDRIAMNADLADENNRYVISGADEADNLQILNDNKNEYLSHVAHIRAQFDELLRKDPSSKEILYSRFNDSISKYNKKLVEFTFRFVNDKPKTLSSFYAINTLSPREYEKELIEYAAKIKGSFNGNKVVSNFLTRMARLRSVQVGQPAPDFVINSIDGKPVKLSDFKGSYVLLDFWASWCMPCREENPNIVRTFNQFKNKNFKILSVSLDTDLKEWKQAIQADKLAWTHVSELKDFDGPTVKLYQIESIPSSFIIDADGKIIAKNLQGPELGNFLGKVL